MKASRWIWCAQNGPREYNQTVRFRKDFEVGDPAGAVLRITADSWYRARVNGQWLNDGPARAYPEQAQYDELDAAAALKPGRNRIEVVARYFGCGTFHQIPQAGGLRAELHAGGQVVGTDTSWLASPAWAWRQWTPKISIQMEPVEEYDARLEQVADWQPAIEAPRPGKLVPRNTGLLTKKPRRPKALRGAAVVGRAAPCRTVPVALLAHGETVEANGHTSRPVVLGAVLAVRKKRQFDFSGKGWKVAVDGRLSKSGKVTLAPGRHAVLFFCAVFSGHGKECAFPFLDPPGASWGRWTVCVVDEFLFRDDDMVWFWFEHKALAALERRWLDCLPELARQWRSASDPFPASMGRIPDVPEERVFMEDPAAEFAARRLLGPAGRLFDGKTVMPSPKGDVELCYDFGEETCGYFEFSITADEGVVVDLNAVEYIDPAGVVQHTLPFNRNGMRYVAKQGANRFTSLKRRAGRYLFLTLRNQKAPVQVKAVRIVESTAPVEAAGSFRCSDPLLNKVWGISERTLQLCMEDTFTDCPLYEQTLWIGDARNEALYAATAYGNFDVSARSLELGAQSLGRYPLVGCQVPSSWDCLLPAWSFLWGMHVWEHYFHSGDKRLLKRLWPAVLQNLAGAERFIDGRGLFSATMWNLLEWAAIDHAHATVLHNSMLLAGALDAAGRCAQALGDPAEEARLARRRRKLCRAINAQWDESKRSYPDAILEDGRPSPKTCQHTSMLAIMCGIAPPAVRPAALQNLLRPPRGMTPVGSPFAMQFMYEALEEAGEFDALLDSIREKFRPMIEVGATTVWETFAGSDFDAQGFPTRSHCHAWSASPVWFLNRVVLGIRQTAPGGKAFEISPWLGGLAHASGATATPRGPVSVAWRREGKILEVRMAAPEGTAIGFRPNASHEGLEVRVLKTG